MAASLRNPRYLRSARAPNAFAGRQRNPRWERDMQDGGGYQIQDYVDELGVYGAYRVLLLDRKSGRTIRQTWSGADGSYAFLNLANNPTGYTVIAFDHTAQVQNAAIADWCPVSPMP